MLYKIKRASAKRIMRIKLKSLNKMLSDPFREMYESLTILKIPDTEGISYRGDGRILCIALGNDVKLNKKCIAKIDDSKENVPKEHLRVIHAKAQHMYIVLMQLPYVAYTRSCGIWISDGVANVRASTTPHYMRDQRHRWVNIQLMNHK